MTDSSSCKGLDRARHAPRLTSPASEPGIGSSLMATVAIPAERRRIVPATTFIRSAVGPREFWHKSREGSTPIINRRSGPS